MKRNVGTRSLAVLIGGGLAGAASMPFQPVMAARGAVLGLFLSAGILAINWISRKDLSEGHPPNEALALLVGAVAGLLAGVAVNMLPPHHDDFIKSTPPGWATFIVTLAWAVALHGAYAVRWIFRPASTAWRFVGCVLLTTVAGVAAGAVRVLLTYGMGGGGGFAFVSILDGAPFGLFWGVAVALFDPAFSFEPWEWEQPNRPPAPAPASPDPDREETTRKEF